MRYFFDSSALAKLFLSEQHSAAATSLVESTAAGNLGCSRLAWLEVRSAIQRKLLYREISSSLASQALTLLQQEEGRWHVVPINDSVLEIAATCIDRHALRALDAIQLATALLASRERPPVTFVAYDQRLLKAAQNSGLVPYTPRDLPLT